MALATALLVIPLAVAIARIVVVCGQGDRSGVDRRRGGRRAAVGRVADRRAARRVADRHRHRPGIRPRGRAERRRRHLLLDRVGGAGHVAVGHPARRRDRPNRRRRGEGDRSGVDRRRGGRRAAVGRVADRRAARRDADRHRHGPGVRPRGRAERRRRHLLRLLDRVGGAGHVAVGHAARRGHRSNRRRLR